MITMNELVDLRMQQHIAHEIYRQQIMQRIPGKSSAQLSVLIVVSRAPKILRNGLSCLPSAYEKV